jgi:hypothetical protein
MITAKTPRLIVAYGTDSQTKLTFAILAVRLVYLSDSIGCNRARAGDTDKRKGRRFILLPY